MSSNPTPSPNGTTGPASTRQLLDELDALMQRMLALPVNQPEGERETTLPAPVNPLVLDPEAARSGPALAPPVSPPARHLSEPPVRRLPRPAEPGPVPALEEPPRVRLRPVVPDSEVEHAPVPDSDVSSTQEDEDTEQPVGERESIRLPEALGPGILQTLRADIPEQRLPPKPTTVPPRPRKGLSWWLRPLAWINRVFEGFTRWLGPLGRWLRGPVGKNLLGWSGLLMLLGALSWQIMLWCGWL